MLLPLIVFNIQIFQLDEKWKMVFGILLSIIVYIGLEITKYSLLIHLRPQQDLIFLIRHLMLFSSIFILIFVLLSTTQASTRIEIELMSNKELLNEVITGSSGVFFQYELKKDGKRVLNFISEKIFQLMEITPNEVQKDLHSIYKIVLPEFKENVKKEFLHSFKNFCNSELEFKIQTKSGNVKWIEVKANIQKSTIKDGRVLWNGSFHDITQRKISEDIFHVTTNELINFKRAVDEHCLVSITDVNGKILYVNSRLCQISEYTEQDLIGKSHSVVNSYYHPKEFWKEMWDTIKGKNIWRGVIRNKTKTGKFYWVNATIFPLLDQNDKPYRFVAIRTDITNLKKSEEKQKELNTSVNLINEKLLSALEKADEANRAKNLFVSSVSHELRTPLNAIIGFSELLKNDKKDIESQKKYIELTNQSAKHLLGLINEILEFSSIEAKKFEIVKEEIDLSKLLSEISESFLLQTKEKNLQFISSFAESIPEFLIGDTKRLKQVFINLLGNAVKFTHFGKIEFIAEDKNQNVQNRDLVILKFIVKDTGMGISKEGLKKIFEPFHRETINRIEGTGLGLSLSKKIVNAFGSELHVESEIGKGSNFWFELSLPIVHKKDSNLQAIVKEQKNYSGNLALIVDDVELNRILLNEVLTGIGFQTDEASNGKEALEILKTKRPDIILMDVVMPVLDGIETIKILKNNPDLKTIPTIAVTASGFEGKREELISYGFDEYLLKPMKLADLFQKLENLL